MNVPDEVVIKFFQDSEQCLEAVRSFGHVTYVNICTGQIISVPWGSVDWALLGMLSFALLGSVIALAILIRN